MNRKSSITLINFFSFSIDEGVYVCEAQNTVGTISVSASLAVHGKNLCFFR